MEIVGAVLGPVVECIISPVGRQLGYLIYYKRNVKDLEKQLKNLQVARERVQNLVNEAKGNSYTIYDDVSSWLVEVDAEFPQQTNEEGGSNRNNDSNLWCPKLRVLCYPRKTKKRMDYILKLIEEGKQFDKDNVGYSVPLPITKSTTLPLDYQIFESRTLIAKNITNALADPNVNKVGVSGMGGVGKTKLVHEVKKLVLESKLFDHVIDVTVGESKDVKSIQDQIKDQLNIEIEGNSEMGRASRLQTKIVEMKNNILIVLDDLWKEYDLEKDIGIPCRLESRKEGYCKILITSRSQDLLTNQLNIENMFEVNPLDEKESWKFFVAIVGEFVEVGIEYIAKNVVQECRGLPLALAVLAKALKRKKIQIWKDFLNKLINHTYVGIPGMEKKLYTVLKLSYNLIADEEAKSLFLICSVFPDDYDISVDQLQMYAMGMGILRDINSWEDAKNRVMKLVEDLTSSYLLIYSDEDHHVVQMHDVIRDVAKNIALEKNMRSLTYRCGQTEWREKERYRSYYYTIFVHSMDVFNLPPKLEFPNLRLLILRGLWDSKDTQIPDAFFEGMENLRVLDMENVYFEPSRTSLTYSLKNLQTLCLLDCEHYDMDTIGELHKLKILKIDGSNIEELPANMSQLTELKVLKVSDCYRLKVIHPNIISSMTKLEELNLVESFKGWGEEVSYKGTIIKNVKLSELNCLTQLSILRIYIQNADMLSNELSLEIVQKLQDFEITGGNDSTWYHGYPRTMRVDINWKTISCKSGVLETLMQGCVYLDVRSNSVDFTKALFKANANHFYPLLKRLEITIDEEDSTDMAPHDEVQNITPFFATDHQVSFSELMDLNITIRNNLEMLWHNDWITASSFGKLQTIRICDCHQLKYVFPSNMIKSLGSLDFLEVMNCELVEKIFEIEDSMDDPKIVMPLTSLHLFGLPNLKYVWSNDPGDCLTFPNLEDVNIYICPASFMKHMGIIKTLMVNGQMELFVEDEVSKLIETSEIALFPSLKILKIDCKVAEKRSFCHIPSEWFPKLQTLKLICSEDDGMVALPLEMSKLVYAIENLTIEDAIKLVEVFQNGEKNEGGAKLKTLVLERLPKLTHVWEDNNTQIITSFDSLEHIRVYDCVNLKYLLPSSITFFTLRYLEVDNCNGMMNLFSSSVANKLVNLTTMSISKCEGMSSIVVAEGEEEEITFKRLNCLKLIDLPRLMSFHSGKSTLKFPCLDELHIRSCHEMMTFSYGLINMSKLLRIYMEEDDVQVSHTEDVNLIIKDFSENVEIERSIKNLFTQEIALFPSLKILKIDCKVAEKRSFCHIPSESFPKLQTLELIGSKDDGMVALPIEMSKLVYTIKELMIHDAIKLVKVFQNGEKNEGGAKLKALTLQRLPKLTHVWEDNNTQMITSFDSLERIGVYDCANLKYLLPSSITFFNLTHLRVYNCNGMMNLFSSSVANKLVNLTTMSISKCEGMSSIVVAEGEEEEITFKRLNCLKLIDLPRLMSFHSGKSTLKFPCLDELHIRSCHEMMTFSYGLINMSKLLWIYMKEDCVQVSHTEDVNLIIKDFSERSRLRKA